MTTACWVWCAAMPASSVVHAGLLEMPYRLHHVFHVAAGLALAAADDADLLLERKAAGILGVVAVDQIGQGLRHAAEPSSRRTGCIAST